MGASVRPVASDPVADYLAAKGATATDPVSDYLAAKQKVSPLTPAAETTQAPPSRQPIDVPEYQPTFAQKAVGTAEALGHKIPFVETAQAKLRSMTGGVDYQTALKQIHDEEKAAPKVARIGANLVGGGVAALAMPGSPAVSGALYGGAEALGNSEPVETLGEKVGPAIKGAAIGGTIGKASQLGSTLYRATAPTWAGGAATLGKQSDALRKTIGASDAKLYGAAESEAAAGGGTSPEIQAALNHPRVKPLADDIRESFALQGKPANDATVLMQAHRELSQNERALIDRTANANSARPMTTREKGDVQAVKEILKSAASDGPTALMPSFRPAVAAHADLAGQNEAMQQAADATGRIARGAQTPGRKLATQSPEAFGRSLQAMSPEDAQAALGGILGRTQQRIGLNPIKALRQANRISPFVDKATAVANGGMPSITDVIRSLGVTSGANP